MHNRRKCRLYQRIDFWKYSITRPFQYATGKEEELWKDFINDMELGENDDFANWLYWGKRKDDRPADMGYYIGYTITNYL